MAGTKKPAASSKTAHVMSLLGKGRGSDDHVAGEAVSEGSLAQILTADAQDAAVSTNIKQALERALEEEGAEAPAADLEAPRADDAPIDGAIVAAPIVVPAGPHAPVEAEGHAHSDTQADVAAGLPAFISCVNVMQSLVEERVGKYMELFGICTCARCKADATALALCNLPPKYVVMSQGEMIPRITLYEQQYSAAITAAIVRSCKVVLERPHHDR